SRISRASRSIAARTARVFSSTRGNWTRSSRRRRRSDAASSAAWPESEPVPVPYLIDGNNLLGSWGGPQEGDDRRHEVVRRVAAFCRGRRAKATVVFDGHPLRADLAAQEDRKSTRLNSSHQIISYAVFCLKKKKKNKKNTHIHIQIHI